MRDRPGVLRSAPADAADLTDTGLFLAVAL
jgi:hypothetical protein